MASPELSGLVDPSQPLDPAAKRALAAREFKRLGPTPGAPPPPKAANWADQIRVNFAGLQNEAAREILECVLDPIYSKSARPAGVDSWVTVYVERAVENSGLPDRMHTSRGCPEVLAGQVGAKPVTATIWQLTRDHNACHRCLTNPTVDAALAIRGRDRHRVNIRTDVLAVLDRLQHGEVHWPAVRRLAALGTERWAPRYENGYIDRGNPEHWAADPIAEATVDLAVAVGHATGHHLAALWDAAMFDVLAKHARTGASAKIRRKAAKALDAALEGHSWEELSGVVAAKVDTALTRRKSIEKRVGALLVEFEAEIGAVVAHELEALEQPEGPAVEWSAEMASEDVSDKDVLGSRIAMAWHGGPVPAVICAALAFGGTWRTAS